MRNRGRHGPPRTGELLIRGRLAGEIFDDLHGVGAEASTEIRDDFASQGYQLWPASQRVATPEAIPDLINLTIRLQPIIGDLAGTLTTIVLCIGGAKTFLRWIKSKAKVSSTNTSGERVRITVFDWDTYFIEGDESLLEIDETTLRTVLQAVHPSAPSERSQYWLLWKDGYFWIRVD